MAVGVSNELRRAASRLFLACSSSLRSSFSDVSVRERLWMPSAGEPASASFALTFVKKFWHQLLTSQCSKASGRGGKGGD